MSAILPSSQVARGVTGLKDWLDSLGWGECELSFLAGDASFRTYYRIVKNKQSRVVMVAPPDFENPKAYIQVTDILGKCGVSVPRVYHANLDKGFVLLEDFGDRIYGRCLKEGAPEKVLYTKAVETLIHLQKNSLIQSELHLYDEDAFLKEALVFLEWAFPRVTGVDPSPVVERSYKEVWAEVYRHLPPVPQGIVLRDYMVDNIVWLEDREGVQECGLLDFQDALWGDVTYDLVSLLEDARRDVSAALAKTMIEMYLEKFPELDRKTFEHSYYVWGAQRSTKIIGVFNRLALRDQKDQYLCFLPRVWKLLKRDMQHPALTGVKHWFDEYNAWGDSLI